MLPNTKKAELLARACVCACVHTRMCVRGCVLCVRVRACVYVRVLCVCVRRTCMCESERERASVRACVRARVGTPVNNNLSELFVLLHFLMPALFDAENNILQARLR